MRDLLDKAACILCIGLFALAFVGIVLFYTALAVTYEGAIRWDEGWEALKSHYSG